MHWMKESPNDAEFGLLLLGIACTVAANCPARPPNLQLCRLGVDGDGGVLGLGSDTYEAVCKYGNRQRLSDGLLLKKSGGFSWPKVVFFIRYAKVCLPSALSPRHAARLRALLPQLAQLPESL